MLSRDAVLTVTVPKRTDVRVIPVRVEGQMEEEGSGGGGGGGRIGTKRPSLSQPDPGPSPSKRSQDDPFARDRNGVNQGRQETRGAPMVNGAGHSWGLDRGRDRDQPSSRRSGLLNDSDTAGGSRRRRNLEEEEEQHRSRRRTSKYEEAKEINIPIVLEDPEDGSAGEEVQEVSRPAFLRPRDVSEGVGSGNDTGRGGGLTSGLTSSNRPHSTDLGALYRRPAQPDKPAASVNGAVDVSVNGKENVKPSEDKEWTYSGLYKRDADRKSVV